MTACVRYERMLECTSICSYGSFCLQMLHPPLKSPNRIFDLKHCSCSYLSIWEDAPIKVFYMHWRLLFSYFLEFKVYWYLSSKILLSQEKVPTLKIMFGSGTMDFAKEEEIYPLSYSIAEFGGCLGLLLGFSFLGTVNFIQNCYFKFIQNFI